MESIAEEGPAASFRQSPFLPSIKEDVNHRLDSFNVAEAADTLTELKFKPRLACRWSQYFGQETLKSYLSDTVARSNDGKLNKSSKIIRKEMPLFVESAGHDVLVMESMEKARLARKASEKIRQADKHRMATKPKRAPTTKAMLEQCEKISAMHVSEETEIALPKMANAEQEKCASVDVKESDKPVQCTKSQASKNFPSIGTDSMKWLFEVNISTRFVSSDTYMCSAKQPPKLNNPKSHAVCFNKFGKKSKNPKQRFALFACNDVNGTQPSTPKVCRTNQLVEIQCFDSRPSFKKLLLEATILLPMSFSILSK